MTEPETLEARLRRGTLPAREAVRIAVEIARALAQAHARGSVHHGLSPARVLLGPGGEVQVEGLGEAGALGRRAAPGDPSPYLAPEQRTGAPADERSDVFALGAILFELLTGELALPSAPGGTTPSWRRPRALEVPGEPALAALVARLLERDPSRRPRDAEVALAELAALQGALGAAPPDLPVRRRRAPWWGAALVGLGVILGMAVAIPLARHVDAPGPPPAPVPAPDDRVVVAVADFANETGDPDLDGLSGLLVTSLEQSKSLRVLTRGRLADLVRAHGPGDVRRVDEPTARAVGRAAGVGALLLPSIRMAGDGYAVELRALDPRQDGYLFALAERASAKEDLLPLIDRLSERIRLALREPEAAVRAKELRVGAAVTGNLEAYGHYFRAKELAAQRGALREAAAEFARAAELDPSFVLARVEAAWIGYFAGTTPRSAAREILRDAARQAARTPEKEAGLVRILTAFFDARFAASRAESLALVARYPEDRDVATLAGGILGWSGYTEDALPLVERALRLAPDWDFFRFEQVELLAALGRADEALRLAEEAAGARATPTARAVVGAARYTAGDVEGGVLALGASGAVDPHSRSLLAQGLAAQGKIDEALLAVAGLRDALGDRTRAQVLAYAGRLREGLAFLDAASRHPGADVGWARQITARYLAAAGDVRRAREVAAQGEFFGVVEGVMLASIGDEQRLGELVRELAQGSTFHLRFLRALSARRAGDGGEALAELRALDRGTVSFVPYFHGLAAAEAGLDEEAVEAFGRFLRPAFWASDAFEAPWLVARARFLLARSLARLGRRDEARRVLDLQLARWESADPDLPLLSDLKALRAALAAGRSVE